VKGFRKGRKREPEYEGLCVEDKGKFFITLKLYQRCPKYRHYQKLWAELVLVNLAHELAHTKIWPHNPAHFALTTKILRQMSRFLLKFDVDLGDDWPLDL